SIGTPPSPQILQLLAPLREAYAPQWEAMIAGVCAAPDPALAAANLSRLAEHGFATGQVLNSPVLLRDLLFLLGASQHLASVLLQQGPAWESTFVTDVHASVKSVADHLAALQAQLPLDLAEEDFLRGLRLYRNREYLRIGTRDLLALASLEDTTRDLSALAEAAVQMAYLYTRAKLRTWYGEAMCDDGTTRRPVGFVVLGMGKLGGEELNFSSDIDLIYLYERDGGPTSGGSKGTIESRGFFTHLAQGITRALSDLVYGGRVFRVDLRLRPDGVNGPVVNSLPNTLLYYESWGQTWERMALLKARPIAGEIVLGEHFLREIAPFVFRRYLDFSTIEDIKEMKARVERSLRGPERDGRNVKLGHGGIREIEFIAQALQLIHAGKDPHVRERNTLAALDRLADGRYLAAPDRDVLRDAYRFLRQVEHKLQVVQDRQTHSLPDDEAGMLALARRLRFPPPDEVSRFQTALRTHTEAVHHIFRSLFHGPDSQASAQEGEIAALLQELHHEERTLWRLQRLGFRQLEESYRNLRLLHDGPPHSPASPKRRKILYALAPRLFHEVTRAADPDRALAAMAQLIASIGARSSFLSLLRENPQTLRTLINLFGTSAYLSQIFLRHPELLDSLVRADLVRLHKDRDAMQAELLARLAEVEELEDRLDILRRYRTEEFLRIGIHDSNGLLDVTEVSRQLTELAEACLAGAYTIARSALLRQLGLAEAPGRLVIVGMGKLGAGELNYNSDLDLIFLYDVAPAHQEPNGQLTAQEFFTKLAQRLISVLQVQTREGYVYKIDTRLRPSGRSGSLVSSLASFVRYHQTSSQLWERQALIKARVVAGDMELKQPVEDMVERFAYGETIDAAGVAEIDRLRARMEQELAKEWTGRFNIKTGRGGIVDIEFLVQMLQLRYGRRFPALRQRATLPALDALHACGILGTEEYQTLTRGYRFLRTLENRLRIEQDQPVEALESGGPHLIVLARRLGYEGDGAAERLLADYQSQREAIRACYNQVFTREKGQSA
ncbi:MAG: bifunctional [glutamate--ammonia ligase]-adenylyl-L-tyrosine phosphorylase/[glutamate--ammonia-ligase] adenylyltransferase, partial [Candidatus Binatia bacterium]|nr:bifunctional [glutamate--ammonia ligase]-adenylyl-L-tyrosine phosphorylase/[glutamate--ammonia-ligase] adenylyltransferase [Candidatus Binatia bacterium]